MRTNVLLISLMTVMLILLRGTRAPNSLAWTVFIWVLALFVVAFTFATIKFPSMRWTHLGAAVSTLVLFLIPPVSESWLSSVPDVFPAGVTLAYLSALYLQFANRDVVPQVSGGKRVGLTIDDVLLGVVLLWIGSAPDLLGHLIKGQMESAVEWDGAWAPIFGAAPALILLVAYSLARRGLQRAPDSTDASKTGEGQDA